MSIQLTSSAFNQGETIPDRYTCRGENISPPLNWGKLPPSAKSLALLFDDPDAPGGTWVHWVLYNLPAGLEGLPEGYSTNNMQSAGTNTGRNSWGKNSYGGPCPPSGTHRYFFRFYVLDKSLALEPGASESEVLGAMAGHILGQAELMGRVSHR